ncbi:MAG: hypothetical protein ABI790_17230 [Betaproteobacteria bacterium]
MKPGMGELTKLLEEVQALRMRNGGSTRDALAQVMANQQRSLGSSAAAPDRSGNAALQIQLPAASRLDELLPRDREPTIEEIRQAWKECTEQASLYGAPEHFEDIAEITLLPLPDNH